MGWATGSEIAEEVWDLVRPLIAPENRKQAALRLIDIFENFDCDTMDECRQLVADAKKKP